MHLYFVCVDSDLCPMRWDQTHTCASFHSVILTKITHLSTQYQFLPSKIDRLFN